MPAAQTAVETRRTVVLDALADHRLRDRLLGVAMRFRRNRADAEDCVQDALVLATRHADEFADPGSPTGWILTILRNSCLMQVRRDARHVRGRSEVDETALVSEADAPDKRACHAEMARRLDGFLADIGPEDARIFHECVVQEGSPKAYASRHGLSTSCVKTRVYRLRHRVADTFGRRVGEGEPFC